MKKDGFQFYPNIQSTPIPRYQKYQIVGVSGRANTFSIMHLIADVSFPNDEVYSWKQDNLKVH